MVWNRLSPAFVAIFVLAGCADNSDPPLSVAAPDFRQGYSDGCASGYHDAWRAGYHDRFKKDVRLFDTDPLYQQGWTKGQGDCYFEEFRLVNPPLGPG